MNRQAARHINAILTAENLRAFAFPDRLDLVTEDGEVSIVKNGRNFDVRYQLRAVHGEKWESLTITPEDRTHRLYGRLIDVSRPRAVKQAEITAALLAELRGEPGAVIPKPSPNVDKSDT